MADNTLVVRGLIGEQQLVTRGLGGGLSTRTLIGQEIDVTARGGALAAARAGAVGVGERAAVDVGERTSVTVGGRSSLKVPDRKIAGEE